MGKWLMSALFLLLFFACDPDTSKIDTAFAEKRALLCRMEQLKAQNDSLWNGVNQALEESLPTDMPPDERHNMLAVKNAGLIAMFQVFPELDTTLQEKVMMAGKADETIAEEMKEVMEKLALTENNLNSALEKLQSQNKNRYLEVKQELLEKENLPCN